MADTQMDKGRMCIRLKIADDKLYLRDMNLVKDPEEVNLLVGYEDGCIFIDWKTSGREVIGYYRREENNSEYYEVLDKSADRVIGRVGDEIIHFYKENSGYTQTGECLAFYTQNGGITVLRSFPYVGSIDGGLIGGAAAFVAIFYAYRIKSVYRDFFDMDIDTFREVHRDYLKVF